MKLNFYKFTVEYYEKRNTYALYITYDTGEYTQEFTNVNDLWQEIGKLLKGDLA